MKKIILSITCLLLAFSLSSCSKNSSINYNQLDSDTTTSSEYNKFIVTNLNAVQRQSDVIADTGFTSLYEIPGNGVIESTSSKKTAILSENTNILNYDKLDEEGKYYLNDVYQTNSLFKHRSADSQVATYLLDDTAVTKTMFIRNNIYQETAVEKKYNPVNITGLYAPAGELIKVEISEELANTNPVIYIGATAINGETNDIDDSDTYTRFPNRVKQLVLDDTVNYIGSPLGGQIYIQSELSEYTVTITGAVEYLHYVHGSSTRDDLVRLYDSTAPMIDIELPNYLRINMPRNELQEYEDEVYNNLVGLEVVSSSKEAEYKEKAKEITIDSIIDTVELWEMFCDLSSNLCPEDLFRTNEITFFYDSYVVSNNYNSNLSFCTMLLSNGKDFFNTSLDKTTLLRLYNMHFWNNEIFVEQGSNTTTSEIFTILSYMLYDTYGQYRTYANNIHDYSDAGYTLNLLNGNSSALEVAKYVTLMHSFGAKTFINAITTNVEADTIKDRLFLQFSIATQTNMEYYFTDVLGWDINGSYITQIDDLGLKMYLPVASSLQIGQVINGQKVYTVQNYGAFNDEVTNINNSIVVPTGMDFEILDVTASTDNLIVNNGVYYYSTNLEEIDEFTVTVKVSNDEYQDTITLIMGVAVQHYNYTNATATTLIYSNPDDLDFDDLNYDLLTYYSRFDTITEPNKLKSNFSGEHGVFLTEAVIYFPEAKEYTLKLYGLGDMRISYGSDYSNMEIHEYKKEGTASTLANTTSSFTYDASKSTKMVVKIEMKSVAYSSSQRIELGLGYGTTSFSDVSGSMWYAQYSSPTRSTSATTHRYEDTNEISIDNYNIDELDLNITYSLANSKLNCNTSNNTNHGLCVTYAEIQLPEAKEYTFVAAVKGDVRISIGTDFDNLEEVVRYKQENTNSGYDLSIEDLTFKVNGKYSQRIMIKIEIATVVHTDGANRVEFILGYQNGTDVTNIPDSWWNGQSTYEEPISSYYKPYNTTSFYKKETSFSSFERVDQDLNIIYQTSDLDDKFLTTPNSDKQSLNSNSIIIYKYTQAVSANFFALTSASDVDGVVSFFEVHVSNDGLNWTEAYNGINPYQSYNRMELNDTYTFRYVKLVFGTPYSGSRIDICNFDFLFGCSDLAVLDLPSETLLYTGSVDLINSSANLNENLLEFDGRIKFSVTGESLILFCNTNSSYGKISVTVNGQTYTIDLSEGNFTSKQVLTIALEKGTHDVEIKVLSGKGNIDFIAFG